MKLLASLRSVISSLFRRTRIDEDMDEELRSHIQHRADDLEHGGLPRPEAERRARIEFGGYERSKEEIRQTLGGHLIESLLQDMRFGARMLRKNPGFSILAVLTLALGIALNTSIFSTVSGLLLKPPPVSDPDRLMMVASTNQVRGYDQLPVSVPDFNDWRQQNQSFEGMAADAYKSVTLTGEGAPTRLNAMQVSANFFSILGASPAYGRAFVPSEEAAGKNHVIILSHELWQQRFGADPKAIGRSVMLDGEPYAVVGVMPRSFRLITFPGQIWIPITFTNDDLQPDKRSHRFLYVFARLKPGVSANSARADIAAIANQSAKDFAQTSKGWGTSVTPLQEFMVRDLNVRGPVTVMMSAVGFILMLACANLSSLLLTKMTARHHEMGIRTAIGASRWRLIRQLLAESLILCLLGGGLGLLLSFEGIHLLRLMLYSINGVVGATFAEQLTVDTKVLIFTLVISVFTAFVVGLAPAIEGTRANPQMILKNDNRGGVGEPRSRLRNILVATEIALASVLLIGTGFLITGIIQSLRLALGFNPEQVVAADVSLSGAEYRDSDQKILFFRQVIQKLEALPGVTSAAAATNAAAMGARRLPFQIEGDPEMPLGQRPLARYYVVTDNYLQTMGIPLLRGRTFSNSENKNELRTALVNELLAERFFKDGDALGKMIRVYTDAPEQSGWRQIIGIVGNVKNWPGQTSDNPQVYDCYWQQPAESMTLVIRTKSNLSSFKRSFRDAIWSVDKSQPVEEVESMKTLIQAEQAADEMAVQVFGLFAVVAVILAAIGVYGVAAYSAAQHTHEIGVRMALGAQKSHVIRLMLGGNFRLTVAGCAIGLVLAWPLPRLFMAVIHDFEVSAGWIYIVIPIVMGCIAMLATYFPARRASKVDPLIALRYE